MMLMGNPLSVRLAAGAIRGVTPGAAGNDSRSMHDALHNELKSQT
jgi:hypothetical protein